MDLQYEFGPDAANPAGRRVEQLERLLGCFQKALGHELPNQLVALQGLARLIEMEQADRLDDEGRAHLLRLADLARRDGRFDTGAGGGRSADARPRADGTGVFGGDRSGGGRRGKLSRIRLVDRAMRLTRRQPFFRRRAGACELCCFTCSETRVQADGGRASSIEMGSRRVADGIEWWVKDDGRGLSETQAPRLFECFAGGGTTA